MKHELLCTICPVGCELLVEHNGKHILTVEGNRCHRGEEYAEGEIFHPKRIVTTTVAVEAAKVPFLPVRTERAVPKDLSFRIIEAASRLVVSAPVRRGDVLICDILNTGVNLIATRSLDVYKEPG
jgi:CxxC motif-containing protein